jgi:hypothetical protein
MQNIACSSPKAFDPHSPLPVKFINNSGFLIYIDRSLECTFDIPKGHETAIQDRILQSGRGMSLPLGLSVVAINVKRTVIFLFFKMQQLGLGYGSEKYC